MAKKQNPYQLWLGLNPKLTNPNLFQLLGVDPRDTDEAAIKQKAVGSAKVLLQKLKAVEVKSDAEKVFKQKLHAKIVLAHETLVTPEKRKQYRRALIAKAEAVKQSASKTLPAPPITTATNRAAPTSPPKIPNTGTPNAANPTAGSPLVGAPSEIPSAIPMAMPVSSVPQTTGATSDTAEAPAFSMVDAPAGQSEPNFDTLDAQPQVRVYAKKRKTSRSWVVPIVVLTLVVGGVGGLISMMTKYSNIFELIPSLKEKVTVVSPNEPNDPAPNAIAKDESKTKSLTVPETPHQAIDYRGDEDPDREGANVEKPLLDEEESVGSMTKPIEAAEMKPDKKNSQSNQPSAKEDDPKNTSFDGSPKENRKIVDARINTIRLALHRSRDALFRQDLLLAKHFNGDVRNLLKRYEISEDEAVAPEQRGLIRAVKTNQQVIKWVDDFWKQVKSSSIEMSGGDSIKIGDKTMALVEGTDEGVVLRIAGQNEAIRYSDLTPVLATTLGALGAKESVPRWNLAQAAYLGMMSDQYPDAKQLQYRILNQLKIDGFDIESKTISDFTEPDWFQLGLPKEKMAPLDDDRFNEIIADQRKLLDYEDPSDVPVKRVDELIYKLTLNVRRKPAIRVARLWEAITIIKKGHRFWDLMYVNRELNDCCTEVDFGKSFVDPVLQIAKENQEPAIQDRIARQIIIFVKQFDGNPSFTPAMRKKLVQNVRKIGKDLKSGQLNAMAEQLSPSPN